MLSPPILLSKTIELAETETLSFEIKPFAAKGANACLLTAKGNFVSATTFSTISNLKRFMTFVKSSHSGIGNLLALNDTGEQAFSLLGFSRNDAFPFRDSKNRHTNWFDIKIQNQLPDIYSGFITAMADSTKNQALRQSIGFYRASTMARDTSIEMAIIAAHTALEAIVNCILEHQAGWSATLRSERSGPFADKMRAAAAYCRLSGYILEKSTELEKLARSRDNADGFQMISFIRNKLVHQDPKFTPTGRQLEEAWRDAMWLVEVFIFHLIDYRGDMIDRRIYSGYRGQTCQVPLH